MPVVNNRYWSSAARQGDDSLPVWKAPVHGMRFTRAGRLQVDIAGDGTGWANTNVQIQYGWTAAYADRRQVTAFAFDQRQLTADAFNHLIEREV